MRLVYEYLNLGDFSEKDLVILQGVFVSYGAEIPNPLKSKLLVVRDADVDNQIVGFYCLQVRLHAEPMWLDEGYRGLRDGENGLPVWFNLVMGIEPFTREDDCYVIAENSLTDEMCKAMNLERVEYPVYVKRKV